MSFKRGFTLAEVLITLSIIGVLAALTIPSLVVKNQEKETVVQLKKAYNVFSNAYMLAKVQNGPVENWGWINDVDEDGKIVTNGGERVLDILAPHLNINEKCGNKPGCFPKVIYRYLDNSPHLSGGTGYENINCAKAVLSDGMIFDICNFSACTEFHGNTPSLKTVCGTIDVDVNGAKGSNQFGKDLFVFYITSRDIIPIGLKEDESYPLSSNCSKTGRGYACAAWVLLKENMDYLKKPISWD